MILLYLSIKKEEYIYTDFKTKVTPEVKQRLFTMTRSGNQECRMNVSIYAPKNRASNR